MQRGLPVICGGEVELLQSQLMQMTRCYSHNWNTCYEVLYWIVGGVKTKRGLCVIKRFTSYRGKNIPLSEAVLNYTAKHQHLWHCHTFHLSVWLTQFRSPQSSMFYSHVSVRTTACWTGWALPRSSLPELVPEWNHAAPSAPTGFLKQIQMQGLKSVCGEGKTFVLLWFLIKYFFFSKEHLSPSL